LRGNAENIRQGFLGHPFAFTERGNDFADGVHKTSSFLVAIILAQSGVKINHRVGGKNTHTERRPP
jgi:hypothetical protein